MCNQQLFPEGLRLPMLLCWCVYVQDLTSKGKLTRTLLSSPDGANKQWEGKFHSISRFYVEAQSFLFVNQAFLLGTCDPPFYRSCLKGVLIFLWISLQQNLNLLVLSYQPTFMYATSLNGLKVCGKTFCMYDSGVNESMKVSPNTVTVV